MIPASYELALVSRIWKSHLTLTTKIGCGSDTTNMGSGINEVPCKYIIANYCSLPAFAYFTDIKRTSAKLFRLVLNTTYLSRPFDIPKVVYTSISLTVFDILPCNDLNACTILVTILMLYPIYNMYTIM